jgi:hypothetical protein
MAAAWEHNPQDEFHGADGVHMAWVALGLLYFLPAALVGTLGSRLLFKWSADKPGDEPIKPDDGRTLT